MSDTASASMAAHGGLNPLKDITWVAHPVDKGVISQYDYAVQIVKELPYARWRDYDSEDTLRFYALRLHEAGMM